MSKVEYIINKALATILSEQDAAIQLSKEFDNAPSHKNNTPFTPAEKKFLGKFDAYGTTHLGIIYSPTDIGIREFITRSGAELNITPGTLLNLMRNKYIKIVPYTGYGHNDDYTLELQLSLDDVKGWGAEDQQAAEKKQDTADASATDMAGPSLGSSLPLSSEEPVEAETDATNDGVIPYGNILQESTKILKNIVTEKKKKSQSNDVEIYVKQSRVLDRLPRAYVKHLEKIISILTVKLKNKFDKERLVADILDNLAINFDLTTDEIQKSYVFHKNQKKLKSVKK